MDWMLDPPDDECYDDGPFDDDFGPDFEAEEYDHDEEAANASSRWQNERNL